MTTERQNASCMAKSKMTHVKTIDLYSGFKNKLKTVNIVVVFSFETLATNRTKWKPAFHGRNYILATFMS